MPSNRLTFGSRGGQLGEAGTLLRPLAGVVWVQAGRGQHPTRMSCSQTSRLFRALQIDTRHYDPVDVGGPFQEQDRVTFVELEVTVGIDPSHAGTVPGTGWNTPGRLAAGKLRWLWKQVSPGRSTTWAGS